MIQKIFKKIKRRISVSDSDRIRIEAVMQKTGWSFKETKKAMQKAKAETGISFADYDRNDFFDVPKELWQEKIEEIKKNKAGRIARRNRANQGRINRVIRNTGWTQEEAVARMDRAKEVAGASYEDYNNYKFWDVSEDIQKTYYTNKCITTLYRKYNVDRKTNRFIQHKDLFYAEFSDYIGRPWMITRGGIDEDLFFEKFKNTERVLYKPRSDSFGRGILTYDVDKGTPEKINEAIAKHGEGVIEGFIKQHHEMDKFSKNAVNTVRIVTIRTNDETKGIETGDVHFAFAGFRMGTGEKFVDNLHSGGLLASIDIDTGIVVTDAVDVHANYHYVHPDTGVPVKGFQIPFFNETKLMLEKIMKEKDIEGFIGWDVAITENGPVLIEANIKPGGMSLQGPYSNEHKGMKFVMQKYL